MSELIKDTLYRTPANGAATNYELQISTTFDLAIYEVDGYFIEEMPQCKGDEFKIVLKLKEGTKKHIVHNFSIGMFPPSIESWVSVVEYQHVNETGIPRKKRKEQAEVESVPKPVENGVLG